MSENRSALEHCTAFMYKIEDLVTEIFSQNSVTYHRIYANVELSKADGNYYPVIRIVAYFENSFKKILALLRNEFDLASEQTTDNRQGTIESNSEMKVQLLAGLKSNRQQMPEYRKDAGMKFKVVITTILEDAKDGISKEIGIGTLSNDLKRSFHRVGVLLEMADMELAKIKTGINENMGMAMPEGKTLSELPVQNSTNNNGISDSTTSTARVISVTPPMQESPQNNHSESKDIITETEEIAAQNGQNGHINGFGSDKSNKVTIETPGTDLKNVETLDMTISDLNSSNIKVNNIENANGISEDKVPEMLNQTTDIVEKEISETPELVTPQNSGDSVSLNIDNVETFNMNVTNMVDKFADPNIPIWEQELANDAKITQIDENSPMTDAWLREYVSQSKVVKDIDSQIAARATAKLNTEIDVEGDVERLKFLKVFTLKQLHERLVDNKYDVIAFAEKWIGKDNGGTFDSGICLFYLEYLLVGKKNDPAFAVEYVLKFISDNDYSARFIIPTYTAVSKTEKPIAAHLTLK